MTWGIVWGVAMVLVVLLRLDMRPFMPLLRLMDGLDS